MRLGDVERELEALAEGEPLPSAVRETARFLASREIWYQFSRNRAVGSCRDAAHVRSRLGGTGIPLHDELKSYLGVFSGSDGGRRPVLLHCRADQLLDIDKDGKPGPGLRSLDVTSIDRLFEDEVGAFDAEYGTVNPFRFDDPRTGEPLLQLFDPSVLLCNEPPFTMMTNAGNRSWAVEFHPGALVRVIGAQARVATITMRPSLAARAPAPTIGILTGNPPEGGRLFWARLNEAMQRRLGENLFRGDISYPSILLRSLPILRLSREIETRADLLLPALEREAISLCREGAGLLALPCPASQYFSPRLSEVATSHGSTFIPMAESMVRYLHTRRLTEVAILGLPAVAEMGSWSIFKALHEIQTEPLSVAATRRVRQLADEVQMAGPSDSARRKLDNILRQYVQSRHVVIALPELSLLLAGPKSLGGVDKIVIDALTVYAEEVVDVWFRRWTQA